MLMNILYIAIDSLECEHKHIATLQETLCGFKAQ